MPYPTGPTDPNVVKVARKLRSMAHKNNAPIWRMVSERLQKSRRSRPAVNLSKINRYSIENDVIVVPGKVLSSGHLEHPVTIAALSFSEQAKNKIKASKSKMLTLLEVAEKHPEGTNVKIIV